MTKESPNPNAKADRAFRVAVLVPSTDAKDQPLGTNASTTFVSIRLPAVASREGGCPFVVKNSFQKKAHAIEVDDGVADVELVHAEYAGDSAVALLQGELRKRSRAKFSRRHFEIADL
jgi:hypothetical protein